MAIDVDVDDSTELLHATLESNEDIPDEALEAFVSNAVASEIRRVYNNRDEIAEQIEQQGGAGALSGAGEAAELEESEGDAPSNPGA